MDSITCSSIADLTGDYGAGCRMQVNSKCWRLLRVPPSTILVLKASLTIIDPDGLAADGIAMAKIRERVCNTILVPSLAESLGNSSTKIYRKYYVLIEAV